MKVTLNNVRLSFPVLFTPEQVNNQGDPKFSAAAIFGRDHPCVPELQKAVLQAATDKWKDKAGEVLKALKAGDRICVHDGDAKPQYDGYSGNLYLNASNKLRPLVIDGQRQPLDAASGVVYSGCYVNMIVELWAQDNQYGKRINASLLGVQFFKDGERLAGGSVASMDDFQPVPGASLPTTGAAPSVADASSLF